MLQGPEKRSSWTASAGEILDSAAEALVCSANPQLNLSGAVGGAFLLRYGKPHARAWAVDS
jgi:O-acetyl-ADP-ribose deacetylase (regulator of RNase III)